jgi:hypothetical protein
VTASTRQRRTDLTRSLVAGSADVTRAERDAARDELHALEVRRVEALTQQRDRVREAVATAQSAVAEQPPGMTAVATYLVTAIAALAHYIDELHAAMEESSDAYLESLELLRPAGESLPPPLRVVDGQEATGDGLG